MASEVIVTMESRKNPKESDCKIDRADITAPTGSPQRREGEKRERSVVIAGIVVSEGAENNPKWDDRLQITGSRSLI
jgi:hypothetical protein